MGLKLNSFVDDLIGSLQEDTITTFFGPPGCGTSTICFEYIVSCLKTGKKVVFVDTEGGFSVERLQLIDSDVDLKNIVVFSPKSFEDQIKVVSNLNEQIKNASSIGLVVVDSLVMLYRLKLGGAPQKINTELGEQLRMLTEISRSYHIPILITNQMYKDFDTKQSRQVGGNLLEYWSKTIVEIDIDEGLRSMILRKHKILPEGKGINFKIEQRGCVEYKGKSRSFKLFK